MSDLQGKIALCEQSVKYVGSYKDNNNRALSSRLGVKVIEMGETCRDETIVVTSIKKPLYHNGRVVGVCGVSFELKSPDISLIPPFSREMRCVDMENKKAIPLRFSQRKILYLLLRGASIDDISTRFLFSRRRVEYQIERIMEIAGYLLLENMLRSIMAV